MLILLTAAGRQALVDTLGSAQNTNRVLDALERVNRGLGRNDAGSLAALPKAVDALCKLLAAFISRPEGCNMHPGLYPLLLRFSQPDTRAQVMRRFGETR